MLWKSKKRKDNVIQILCLFHMQLNKEGCMVIICEPRHEKTSILVFDQVRHKPGCTATGNG